MASSAAPVDFASGNHYTVLGVAHNASEAERKAAELEFFCMGFW
jgi:ABC-type phosphate transport system ATPase subunit